MNIAIDLEYLSDSPTGAILSIGAVAYDALKTHDTFYRRIDADHAMQHFGRTANADTMHWWMQQDKKAQDAAFSKGEALRLDLALIQLSNWLTTHKKPEIWTQGMGDFIVLEGSYRAVDQTIPWDRKDRYDLRTLRHVSPAVTVKEVGTAHNALDDATYQAHVHMAIMNLKSGNLGKSKALPKGPVTSELSDELKAQIAAVEAIARDHVWLEAGRYNYLLKAKELVEAGDMQSAWTEGRYDAIWNQAVIDAGDPSPETAVELPADAPAESSGVTAENPVAEAEPEIDF